MKKMDGWIHMCVDRWMDELMDGNRWMNECIEYCQSNGWMDGWIDLALQTISNSPYHNEHFLGPVCETWVVRAANHSATLRY